MKVRYFDAHTHLNFEVFKNDYKEVINKALQNNIGMINSGTQKYTSLLALEIAKEFENYPIFASVGLHPLHTFLSYHDKKEVNEKNYKYEEDFDFDYYLNLASEKKVVAIGECGLDFFRIKENEKEIKNKQKEIFLKQIYLAYQVKKPLVIHCRLALDELFLILNQNKNLLLEKPGVMHFFAGDKKQAKKFLDLNFYFTFGGVITFSRDYDDVIYYLPKEKILTETDAPYVTPLPYRGRRNEPTYVKEVVKKIAEIKSISEEELENQIIKNTEIVFNLDLAKY
jgi:TatD DNase family protein